MKLDMLQLGHRFVNDIPVYTDGERSALVYKNYNEMLDQANTFIRETRSNESFYISDIFMFGSYSLKRGKFFYALQEATLNLNANNYCRNDNANSYVLTNNRDVFLEIKGKKKKNTWIKSIF